MPAASSVAHIKGTMERNKKPSVLTIPFRSVEYTDERLVCIPRMCVFVVI